MARGRSRILRRPRQYFRSASEPRRDLASAARRAALAPPGAERARLVRTVGLPTGLVLTQDYTRAVYAHRSDVESTPGPSGVRKMTDDSQFQGSFSEGASGVARDHEGHLLRGSFGDSDCPECKKLLTAHAQHTKGSYSEGSGGLKRDESGDLKVGSFGDIDCPICRAEAAQKA